MGKYIIRYDKTGCIGAAVCEVANPENWRMNESNTKADLIDGVFNAEMGMFEKEIDEKDLKKAIESAEACPVRVIHVYEKESGKRLV